MALSVLATRVLTLREVLRVRVCVGLRRRLRVVVVHIPCVLKSAYTVCTLEYIYDV